MKVAHLGKYPGQELNIGVVKRAGSQHDGGSQQSDAHQSGPFDHAFD